MNVEHYKRRLLDKERELVSEIARLKEEARGSGEPDVEDATDAATSDEETSESLEEETLASRMLTEVRDGLHRIEGGTYGKCAACGRPIEAARLEAVPWARYCLEDPKKQDQAAHVPQGGSTL